MPAASQDEPTVPSDVDLILAVAAQDRAAFVALFQRYAGRVKGFMLSSGASVTDAEEVVQEVMVSIWRRAGTFDPERAAVSTWIFTIARNRRIDMIRRMKRPEPDPQDPLFQPDPEPDGADLLSATERAELVRAGLVGLAPEQRQVLLASFYDGLSHGEIAARLDLPLGTVKSRIRLAFRNLRDVLGDGLVEDLTDG
mgnify:CR=1 FL=1